MKNILKFLTALSFLMMAFTAEASIFKKQRTEEYLQNEKVSTDPFGFMTEIFRIKKNVNRTLSEEGLRARDYQLVGVTLYAKSRRGRGKATLVVGEDSDQRRVRKAPNGIWSGFEMDSMRVIHWDLTDNPGEAREGAWQLRFNGKLKIAHVEIHLRSKMRIVRMPLGNKMLGTSNQSETDRIKIKQMLNNRGISPRDYNLKAVRVLAKSKGGNGKAKLMIGQSNRGTKAVKKAPQGNFQKNQPVTFNRINWLGLNEEAQGQRWQIHFRGNNKGKRLVVVLKPLDEDF